MEWQFLTATLMNLGINLVYTIVALFIGVQALVLVDRKLLKHIDIEGELQKGNLAVGIFASSVLLFVALIVTFGFKG